eukprot:CAMPEP_0197055820 /NCGR_PEP_ID=MMETSP1384-20130603/74018_1 /TAXON_ID=29189 /ORGANISM="Ammonia sp." /LENGTH=126 /DNA_ID=CAMNT_0042489541 /DNA_START=30 /DNA_END=410 /DNA_ORIENTATION=+
MAQEEDHIAQIENAMTDEKEWEQLSAFLKAKFMKEVATFHDYNVKYQNEKDAAQRKELADRMIVKFLTLDGDACLPDHPNCYRELKRRLKKLKDKDYPTDLFYNVHDKCVFSISTIWDEYLASKKK